MLAETAEPSALALSAGAISMAYTHSSSMSFPSPSCTRSLQRFSCMRSMLSSPNSVLSCCKVAWPTGTWPWV